LDPPPSEEMEPAAAENPLCGFFHEINSLCEFFLAAKLLLEAWDILLTLYLFFRLINAVEIYKKEHNVNTRNLFVNKQMSIQNVIKDKNAFFCNKSLTIDGNCYIMTLYVYDTRIIHIFGKTVAVPVEHSVSLRKC